MDPMNLGGLTNYNSAMQEAMKHISELDARKAEVAHRSDLANHLAIAGTAGEVCKRLVWEIVEFERQLNETLEVGVRLVTFGQSITFHVRDLRYHGPNLVVFTGETEGGSQVRLVQHINQLSFLLMAVKRLNPDESRQEMGYHKLYEEWYGNTTGDEG